jgi:hypothetical protein
LYEIRSFFSMSLHTVNIGGTVFTFIPTSMVGDPTLSDTLLLNNEMNRWVFLEGCKNEEEELALIHSIVSQATSADDAQMLLDEVGMTLSLESSFLQEGERTPDVMEDLDLLRAWEGQVRARQTEKRGRRWSQSTGVERERKKKREIDTLALGICSSLEKSLATGEVSSSSFQRRLGLSRFKSKKKYGPTQQKGK